MTVLRSDFDPAGAEARANREAMLASLAGLDAEYARLADAGGARAVARHRSRGKLLPRERI